MGHTICAEQSLVERFVPARLLSQSCHACIFSSFLFLAAETYRPLLDMLRPTAGLSVHGEKPFHSAEISVLD